MKKLIDKSTWKRREHFEVFKNFDEPLFGITVRVECSAAYKKAKNSGYPFSLYYLYLSMKAANEIEEFRYRIEDDKVFCYDNVGAGPTIFREDETFGFGYFPYNEDIEAFMTQAKAETERVKAERGLKFPHADEDILHYSTLTWADFSSVNHARDLKNSRSVPKITFGKITHDGVKMWMPVDVHVNHALMDGFHVGKFIERFQELLSCPL
ncbi:MAG: chloramphenicol acetyltransferase [Paludibacter sp.]|nr:chloramphenicol acetyltransferase [Paludibacter sp.]